MGMRRASIVGLMTIGLMVGACGGGGGGGGGRALEVRNQTSDAILTGVEFRDLVTDAVVASVSFSVAPGGVWNGFFDCPSGTYYRVVFGTETDGIGSCVQDDRDFDFQTTLEDDDRNLIWIFQGFFCDGDF
jgi:hypothetical protein